MKNPSITRILVMSLGLLGLPACGGDASKTDAKVVSKTAAKTDSNTDLKAAPKADAKDPAPEADKPAADLPDPNAEKIKLAATVAREISGAPEQADEILGKHGLDRDKLDSLMFEIASDPELTQRYMNARRNS